MDAAAEPVLLPGGFDGMFNVAVDRYEAGRVEEALEIFRFLSFFEPRDQGVWKAMARCHDELGQEEVAAALRSLAEQIAAEGG